MGDTCDCCRPRRERHAAPPPSLTPEREHSAVTAAECAESTRSISSSSNARTHETTNDKQHTRTGLTPAGNTSARRYGLRPVPNRDRPYALIRVGGGVEAREGACKLQSPLALLPSLPISLRTTRTDRTTCALRWGRGEEPCQEEPRRASCPTPRGSRTRAPLPVPVPVVAAAAGPAPGPHHVPRA